jgi:hypothetical protein
MTYQFVDKNFKPPFQVKGDLYTLRKLTVEEVEKDYKAVMSSRESLRQIFCENDDWPSDDMTLEDNYKDLVMHQREFDQNEGFAYTIVTPDDQDCIGCLYIYPFPYGQYDSEVYYWFVDSVDAIMSDHLRNFLNQWLEEGFGLSKPVYPGRDIGHGDYKALVTRLKENYK